MTETQILWTAVGVVVVVLLGFNASVRESLGRVLQAGKQRPVEPPANAGFHSRMDSYRELHDHLAGDKAGQKALEAQLPQITRDQPEKKEG